MSIEPTNEIILNKWKILFIMHYHMSKVVIGDYILIIDLYFVKKHTFWGFIANYIIFSSQDHYEGGLYLRDLGIKKIMGHLINGH